MFRAFNMGVGLVLVCGPGDADRVLDLLATAGEPNAFRIGAIAAGERGVKYV